MQCPQCQKDMKFVRKEATYREDGKEYLRKTYQCTNEDIWVTVETPMGSNKKLA